MEEQCLQQLTDTTEDEGGRKGSQHKRHKAWWGWALWALIVALWLGDALFWLVDWSTRHTNFSISIFITGGLIVLTFGTAGALVITRQPTNPVGWVMTVVALLFSFSSFADGYVFHAFRTVPASLPGATAIAWWRTISDNPGLLALFPLLLLLFPNGKLLSQRWRPVLWLTFAAVLVPFLRAAFTPSLIVNSPPIINPLGMEFLQGVFSVIDIATVFLLLTTSVAAGLSLLLRYRKSQGEERQQLKWLAAAGALLATILPTGPLIWIFLPPAIADPLWLTLFMVGALAVPTAIGVAIFKYHLYSIDIIINKTLVYGTLTGTLALCYFGGIVLLQQFFRLLTGQESQFAIVVSTLAIAALFNPLRYRIQSFIDRRFYRRKYDAQKTLAAFTASLRGSTSADLEHLTGELVRVIEETVQPASLSIWLREEPGAVKAWNEGQTAKSL